MVALETVAEDVTLLREFADSSLLLTAIEAVATHAPFRHLRTPGGLMSVAMTNCGSWGWHSDAQGYRYVDRDPLTQYLWPRMPSVFREFAVRAAAAAGFGGFEPDCCLINRYTVGARMGTHRDLDERDFNQPIVSASIGLPATFLWYGTLRTARPQRVELADGDWLVWGRGARAGYHAVRPIAAADLWFSPSTPSSDHDVRFNLTFRRAR